MTKFQNMKIEINKQQPLDEVVRELERLGYRKRGWIGYRNISFITTNTLRFYTDHSISFTSILVDLPPTTLAQLKAMER